MRTKILIAVVLALAGALLGPGTATATQPADLKSELLARGGTDGFRINARNFDLKIKAADPTDLAFVKATPGINGYTGWHKHPGPSLVIVTKGTLTMREPHHGHCVAQTYGPGQAFVHPEGVHNFVAGTAGAEFYVAYFVPAGAAPLLIDVPVVPRACE
jgi:hypothetical protein